jgi:hypothetical protein
MVLWFCLFVAHAKTSVTGSGTRCLFDTGIRNRFFSGSRISDPGFRHPHFFRACCQFFGVKNSEILSELAKKNIFNLFKNKIIFIFCYLLLQEKVDRQLFSPFSFVAVLNQVSGIGDMEWIKVLIQGKHPGSATLAECCPAVINEIMLHFFFS